MTVYPPLGSPALLIAMEGARPLNMNADRYLHDILHRETVDTGLNSPALSVLSVLVPQLKAWAGTQLADVFPSGSFAKGTANRSGTDIDVFVSLSADTAETLKEIYNKLYGRLVDLGYSPRKQNVSINIRVGLYDVDLVPGKRQNNFGTDHSLYRRKADTWQQTNVSKHISYVRNAKRIEETRVIKLWRNQTGLEFPSFYLELTVIDALYQTPFGNLSANVVKVLEYLRDAFAYSRVLDPANTNNVVSDDMTASEKNTLKNAADLALRKSWAELVS